MADACISVVVSQGAKGDIRGRFNCESDCNRAAKSVTLANDSWLAVLQCDKHILDAGVEVSHSRLMLEQVEAAHHSGR